MQRMSMDGQHSALQGDIRMAEEGTPAAIPSLSGRNSRAAAVRSLAHVRAAGCAAADARGRTRPDGHHALVRAHVPGHMTYALLLHCRSTHVRSRHSPIRHEGHIDAQSARRLKMRVRPAAHCADTARRLWRPNA